MFIKSIFCAAFFVFSGELLADLKVGFSKMEINPQIIDTFIDKNGNAKYEKDIDEYIDNNKNGKFDGVWLAGFHQGRAATKIHDTIYTLAVVIENNSKKVAIVATDTIGMFYDDVLDIRKQVKKILDIDYIVVCSVHNHEVPDIMGIWGKSVYQSGVDKNYLKKVKSQTVKAIQMAHERLEKASMKSYTIALNPEGLIKDTRPPQVFDPDLHLIHFKAKDDGKTLGTIINWANHVEALWSRNTEVSADYIGYTRRALRSGLKYDDVTIKEGIGGEHVFVVGAIGGLMTPDKRMSVYDPYINQHFQKPSFEKARAIGHVLAGKIIDTVNTLDAKTAPMPEALSFKSRKIFLPVTNSLMLLGSFIGLIKRVVYPPFFIRSEVGVVEIGDVLAVLVPGEIYPEIVYGGIENPVGADFKMDPLEVPPLFDLAKTKKKMLFGLANDEIGYIIPKSQWDNKKPWLYNLDKETYGEENSIGRYGAKKIHNPLLKLIKFWD